MWLQKFNAGEYTAQIMAAAIAAWVFGTPGIIILAGLALRLGARARARRPPEQPPPLEEDRIRHDVLERWRQEDTW